MEINPNHPTTQTMHDLWHKLTAIVMHKLGVDHIVITVEDLQQMSGGKFITVQELDDGIHLRFVDEAEAMRLAKEHGGLPN